MGFEKKPKSITEAMRTNDTEHLSAAGRKGAEATNTLKQKQSERAEILQLQSEIEVERRKMEDVESRKSANEHIITSDGEDLDYSE